MMVFAFVTISSFELVFTLAFSAMLVQKLMHCDSSNIEKKLHIVL